MMERLFSFVFVSLALYKKNTSTLSKFRGHAGVVVLAEFGESIPEKNLNTLVMPVHAISVASILNNEATAFCVNENNGPIVNFSAPNAEVLVVDDIITNLKVAKGLLLPYNMKVDVCKNGMTAIEAMKTNRYDLVFMDHRMPDMDGIETTLRIREMGNEDPYYKNVPIIALTANAISGTREMFLENSFNDFLSKPIDTVQLNAIMDKWLPKEKKISRGI
jgi:CheY-like chemotaxis protein